ncbi:MAG: hypothetical protein HDS78_03375 [Bacteroidales bacterium]|nr:hypothetical protein [Bacteroidales bacterium]
MTQKKFENARFYLGPGYLGGFEIVEHNEWSAEGCGVCCFDINGDNEISDGDGFPTSYDVSYVKITETDFLQIKDMFYKAGEAMCEYGEKSGRPLGRPLIEGDYLYSEGIYVHIRRISDDRKNYWGEYLIYDGYSLYFELDTELLTDENNMFEKDELVNEYMIITVEAFSQAVNFAKSQILKITNYLNALYRNYQTQ